MEKRVLAFDFGASSGRAILGVFDGEKITLKEVHRFPNNPVEVRGTVYWDILRLFYEIKEGLVAAQKDGGFSSVGIDTWGVDFGLIGKDGALLENPIHYRDRRNEGMVKKAMEIMDLNRLYDITGIQFMDFNTLFQLLSLKQNRPHILENADKLLFMPDLLNYMLTGKVQAEYSIATTSQMIDLKTNNWSKEILSAFDISERLLPPIKKTGSVIGKLSADLCEQLSIDSAKVVLVASHDTQSAVTAVPSIEDDFIFISCGTWSLFGTETNEPIVNEHSKALNITNEGGYDYSTAFLKNICGLWLIQESRRHWGRAGSLYSYAELERLALLEEPFKCFIDPDSPMFTPMGNMPERVQNFCRRTNQYVPTTVGEIMRCIYESLALKHRYTFEGIKKCTGKKYDKIHIMGGGTKDTLLCEMTANACYTTVLAGPVEATVLGNIAVQLISSGDIKSVKEARKIIANSETLKEYTPNKTDEWEKAFIRFKEIL
ncbi:MAG TPA: rhamnulokinase family protein [Oscillospiraceae bacterium]|nr:rhamnulokinase family protein [Oscillospiraceae bacterium]